MAERWRPISGYEGFYEVSDLGRVRSIARIIMRSNGSPQTIRERILHPSVSNGYEVVNLSIGGDVTMHRVHRLVAREFVSGYRDGLFACHRDGNSLNNKVDNLAWDTPRGNVADMLRHGTNFSLYRDVTHCKNGHAFDARNTGRSKAGNRYCKTCAMLRARTRRIGMK